MINNNPEQDCINEAVEEAKKKFWKKGQPSVCTTGEPYFVGRWTEFRDFLTQKLQQQQKKYKELIESVPDTNCVCKTENCECIPTCYQIRCEQIEQWKENTLKLIK